MTAQTPVLTRFERFVAKSRLRTVIVFAVGYAVVQPLMQLVLRALGVSIAFQTRFEWLRFEIAVVLLGGTVGAAWFSVQRLPPGWRRDWLDNWLRFTALLCYMTPRDIFQRSIVAWLVSTVVASMVVGALWTFIARVANKPSSDAAV